MSRDPAGGRREEPPLAGDVGATQSATDGPLLSITGLTTVFHTDEGTRRAVDGVSLSVARGEVVCLVGESGSGKTVLAESITRLIESPPGEIAGGSIEFDGIDLTAAGDRTLRSVRGGRIGHVFQDPADALNPVYRIGTQVAEAVRLHTDRGRAAARRRAVELLDLAGVPDPTRRVDSYPHELSGGMKQRVSLAIALAGEPDLLIADEPTTALDATLQDELLRLLAELRDELGLAVLFVTHDLGVVARIADRVVVLYGGTVMERGPVEAIFESPGHPYTRALLACLPGRGRAGRPIPGAPPSPIDPPAGCRFAPRCPHAIDDCRSGTQPALVGVDDRTDHRAACLFHAAGYDRAHIEPDGTATSPDAGGDSDAGDSTATDGGGPDAD